MKKRILFIAQSKGGSGKSLLTYLLAEKHRDAVILDLDDESRSTLKQLAYRKPILVSFLDPETERIDRDAFSELFESVIESKKDFFICDLGGGVSGQLPKYFKSTSIEGIADILSESEIDLQIVCVVGGSNNFKSTMDYLEELVLSVESKLKIIVAHNKKFPLFEDQSQQLQSFIGEYNLPLVSFNIPATADRALRHVENVLRDGKGTSNLSPFTALYFDKAIKDLNL